MGLCKPRNHERHLLVTGEEYIDKHYVKKDHNKIKEGDTKTSPGRSNTTTQTSRIHNHKPRIEHTKRDFANFIQRSEATMTAYLHLRYAVRLTAQQRLKASL